MKTIIVLKHFLFAENGIHVTEYLPGDQVFEVSDECAEVAIAEKWAKEAKAAEKIETADKVALETKPATLDLEKKG